MKSAPARLTVFALVAMAQLALPLSMIAKRETTLRLGEEYRFRTAPVDPYDAFRGRYVILRFDAGSSPVPGTGLLRSRRWGYVRLERDAEGFARLGLLSSSPPRSGDYLRVRVGHATGGGRWHVQLPFDRYYMNESAAPRAEAVVRARSRREELAVEARVRVREGFGVVAGLFVDGEAMEEYILRKEQ